MFFGCFDPENIFIDNENIYIFQGDITNVSALKEVLILK